MGPIGSKVIEVKGHIYVFFFLFVPPRSLGRSLNLEGRSRAAPDISFRGSFFEKSRLWRSKVKFMFKIFFCLFPYFSQVLWPIFAKLGGKVEGGPGY